MALEKGQIATDLLIATPHAIKDPEKGSGSKESASGKEASDKKGETPEGLPADVREIERYKQMVASGMQLSPAQARDFQGKVASLKSRLRRFEEAEKKLDSKGSGSDVAINDKGMVYIKTPAGIMLKNLRYITQEDKPYMMTLSQIKEEVYDGNSPFNEDMLNTLYNAVTSSDALKRAREEIKKMDYDSKSGESGSANVNFSLGGYLKQVMKQKKSWKGINDDRFKTMWGQLVDTMTEQDRYRLMLTGIMRNGYTNGDEAAIFDAMTGVLKTDVDMSIIDDLSYNHFGGSGKNDNSEPAWNKSLSTNAMALAMGNDGVNLNGAQKSTLTFGNTQMTIKTFEPMHATNSSGNSYQREGNLNNLINGDSNKSNAYIKGSIYIGDKPLSATSYSKVAFYDRKLCYFPFRRDKNNNVVPDVEVSGIIDNLSTELSKRGFRTNDAITNMDQIVEIARIAGNVGLDGNDRPNIIPSGMENEVLKYHWSVQDLLDNYTNLAYNDKMTNGRFFIAPADVATAIVPTSTMKANGVRLSGEKDTAGHTYGWELDHRNFGLNISDENQKDQIENIKTEIVNYYNEQIHPDNKDKGVAAAKDLSTSIIIMPYQNFDDVPYIMDYIEQADKFKVSLKLNQARGKDLEQRIDNESQEEIVELY